MSNQFKTLGVHPQILKALEEMGFENATPVQTQSIPHVLNGSDLIVRSKTGSGKTAAFGIPMIQQIDGESKKPQALILTPTRELAVQVDSDLKQMSRYVGITMTAVYGQHNINVEVEALNKGVSIVTGTPGRVFDHIQKGTLETKHVQFLVLDEADRMLDMGFVDQVVRIIKTLPKDRITLLFSATMPPEIQTICKAYMKQPVTVEIESETKTVDAIHQVYYRVDANDKRTQLNHLLMIERPDSCMIFCNTRAAVNRVQEYLVRQGYSCQSLHGDIAQSRRLRTIQQFKKGDFNLLIATDVAARGLHIDDLSLVINYDVPMEKDSYVHRIGRTGRAGNGGRAMSLVTSDDIMTLYEIEEHIGTMIEECELPTVDEVNAARPHAAIWGSSKGYKEHRESRPLRESRPHKAHNEHKAHNGTRAHKEHREQGHKVHKSQPTMRESKVRKDPYVHERRDYKTLRAELEKQEGVVIRKIVSPTPTYAKSPLPEVKRPWWSRVINQLFGKNRKA